MCPIISAAVDHDDRSHPLWLDRLGVCLSLACAVHCMSVPVLLSLLPVVGLGVLGDESVEALFLVMSSILAVASLCWGYRLHRRVRTFLLLGAAMAFIAAGRFLVGDGLESICVVMGAGLLASGHFVNRRLCTACLRCEEAAPYSAA